MTKGEKALLTCKPEFAYGVQGSPPKIPPNSTLNFEVELLRWQSSNDVSGDGGVIKKVLVEPSDFRGPGQHDEAQSEWPGEVCECTAWRRSSTFAFRTPPPWCDAQLGYPLQCLLSGSRGCCFLILTSGPLCGTVQYKVRVAGSAEVVAESPEGGVEFTLSAPLPEVPRGVAVALRTMKKGEKALLKIKPECELWMAGGHVQLVVPSLCSLTPEHVFC